MMPWVRSTLKMLLTWGSFYMVCLFILYSVIESDYFFKYAMPIGAVGIFIVLLVDYRAAR